MAKEKKVSQLEVVEEVKSESTKKANSANNIVNILIIIIVFLALLSVGAVYYMYSVNQELSQKYAVLKDKYETLLVDPQKAADEERDMLVDKIGDLITLPKDELPQVATVMDKDALQEQAFFLNSENGDKVLIYSEAKKAVLYRPSTNKIIEVSSLILEDSTNVNQGLSTTSEEPTVIPEYIVE